MDGTEPDAGPRRAEEAARARGIAGISDRARAEAERRTVGLAARPQPAPPATADVRAG